MANTIASIPQLYAAVMDTKLKLQEAFDVQTDSHMQRLSVAVARGLGEPLEVGVTINSHSTAQDLVKALRDMADRIESKVVQ